MFESCQFVGSLYGVGKNAIGSQKFGCWYPNEDEYAELDGSKFWTWKESIGVASRMLCVVAVGDAICQ